MIEINIFASLFLAFMFLLLFFRKETALPNKVLALALLVPALNFANNIFILSVGIETFPWLFFIVQVTATLFAPLTYYYITLMTGMRHPERHRWLLGISLLIVLYGIYIAVRFAMMHDSWQENYLQGIQKGPYPADMLIYSVIFFLHQLLYFSLNAIEVRQYRNEMAEQVSSLTAVKTTYLSRFVSLLWLLTLLTVILYGTINTIYVEYIFLPIVMVTIVFFMVYHAFNQHAVFTLQEYSRYLENVPLANNEPYRKKKTVQTCIETNALFLQIQHHILDATLYRNPEITLQSVATTMEKPMYLLADAIKSSGTTFYEMIRKIRVEKAKEILSDKKLNYTIEAIAYEVGFNSRTSFYRAFKKFEGKDPSQIIKENR